MHSKVDVLIPCGGSADYFTETLCSVLAQTETDIRVVLVDNATTHEKYREISSSFCDPRVSYLRFEERIPIIANWQRCLNQVSSRHFAFIHDDDIWEPNFLATSLVALEQSQATFVLTQHAFFSGNERPSTNERFEMWAGLRDSHWEKLRLALYLIPLGHMCAAVFKRGTMKFDQSKTWNGDQHFFRQAAFEGRGVVNTNSQVYIRQHETSGTNQFNLAQASRESLQLLRENLLEISRLHEDLGNVISENYGLLGNATFFRVMHAATSWPLYPELLTLAAKLQMSPVARNAIRSHSRVGRLFARLPRLAWIVGSLMMDLKYFLNISGKSQFTYK